MVTVFSKTSLRLASAWTHHHICAHILGLQNARFLFPLDENELDKTGKEWAVTVGKVFDLIVFHKNIFTW